MNLLLSSCFRSADKRACMSTAVSSEITVSESFYNPPYQETSCGKMKTFFLRINDLIEPKPNTEQSGLWGFRSALGGAAPGARTPLGRRLSLFLFFSPRMAQLLHRAAWGAVQAVPHSIGPATIWAVPAALAPGDCAAMQQVCVRVCHQFTVLFE